MNRTEELIQRSQQGDESATELLVKENTGLIWSVAKRYMGRGTEVDDLFQLGCLGFIKAVSGFDLMYGTQFSTYAVPKIAGEIRRFLRDDGAIKVSRSIKEKAGVIRAVQSKLSLSLGREPTISEIASETGYSPEDIATAEIATVSAESIQKETGEDGFSLENILSDTESEDTTLERLSLKQAISKLDQREAMVINLRYYHGLTQEKIAAILSVSQVQVSRIEKKAISRLREYME